MNEEIIVNGEVETILPTETFASGFSKRVLVVNTGGDYAQLIPIEFVKDKIQILDGLKAGQKVSVYVNLRGNEYNGKYYANIQGWKLEKTGDKSVGKKKGNPTQEKPYDEDMDDDIPF